MSEKHFHGQSHVKGGFDIDEATMPPNSNYWRGCADGALIRLQNAIGIDEANRQTMNIEAPTWKDVCTLIEMLADLAEKQKATLGQLTALAYGDADLDGSDTSMSGQLQESGFGDGGVM